MSSERPDGRAAHGAGKRPFTAAHLSSNTSGSASSSSSQAVARMSINTLPMSWTDWENKDKNSWKDMDDKRLTPTKPLNEYEHKEEPYRSCILNAAIAAEQEGIGIDAFCKHNQIRPTLTIPLDLEESIRSAGHGLVLWSNEIRLECGASIPDLRSQITSQLVHAGPVADGNPDPFNFKADYEGNDPAVYQKKKKKPEEEEEGNDAAVYQKPKSSSSGPAKRQKKRTDRPLAGFKRTGPGEYTALCHIRDTMFDKQNRLVGGKRYIRLCQLITLRYDPKTLRVISIVSVYRRLALNEAKWQNDAMKFGGEEAEAREAAPKRKRADDEETEGDGSEEDSAWASPAVRVKSEPGIAAPAQTPQPRRNAAVAAARRLAAAVKPELTAIKLEPRRRAGAVGAVPFALAAPFDAALKVKSGVDFVQLAARGARHFDLSEGEEAAGPNEAAAGEEAGEQLDPPGEAAAAACPADDLMEDLEPDLNRADAAMELAQAVAPAGEPPAVGLAGAPLPPAAEPNAAVFLRGPTEGEISVVNGTDLDIVCVAPDEQRGDLICLVNVSDGLGSRPREFKVVAPQVVCKLPGVLVAGGQHAVTLTLVRKGTGSEVAVAAAGPYDLLVVPGGFPVPGRVGSCGLIPQAALYSAYVALASFLAHLKLPVLPSHYCPPSADPSDFSSASAGSPLSPGGGRPSFVPPAGLAAGGPENDGLGFLADPEPEVEGGSTPAPLAIV
eukprot:tig00000754_g3914.t1